MAKVGNLEVTSGKIANQAITLFFSPASSTSVTVTNSTGGPTLIFLQSDDDDITLTRQNDGKVIYQDENYIRAMAIDDDPGLSETYVVSGGVTPAGETSRIQGATVRLK